jgi:hypothetical protein
MAMDLIRFQLKQLFSQPIVYGLLGLYSFIVAVFANQFAHQFIQLQSSNTEGINLSGDLFAPLNGLSLLLCLLLLPLVAAQLGPRRAARGLQRLLTTYPIAPSRIWISDWISLVLFLVACHTILVTIHLPLLLGSHIDWAVYGLQLLAHALTTVLYGSLILLLQKRLSSPLNAIISSFGLLFVLWLITLLAQWPNLSELLQPLNLMAHFRQLSLGLLTLAPLLQLFLGIVFIVLMQSIDWRKHSTLFHHAALLLTILLWLISSAIHGSWDLTSDKRYTLNPILAEQLKQLPDELTLTSYGLNAAAREEVELRLLNPLRQQLANIHYQPIATPAQWEDREPQGLLFQWPEQQIWMGYPFSKHPQQLLYQSLNTLNQRQRHWILFADGHQESPLKKSSSRSLSKLAETLKQRGFKLSQNTLNSLGSIPANTQLLVIASARQEWLPAEQEILLNYLQLGGNLLWLRDPEDATLPWLENYLGVVKIPGTLIDPVGYNQGTPHPAVVLINDYEAHPLLQSLSTIIALPWSSALSKKNSYWQVTPLLHTHPQTWIELQPDQENLSYDEAQGELKGRFPTFMLLQRQQGARQQSVVVAGDSHFLSDQALNNYDNKQLALNLFHWLTQPHQQPLPQLVQASDRHLMLTKPLQLLLNGFNPFILPLVLLISGVWLWRQPKNP